MSSPGVLTEKVYLYLARDLAPTPSATEAAEVLEIHWLPLPEALQRAAAGDITDSKTVFGLFRASYLLNGASIGEM